MPHIISVHLNGNCITLTADGRPDELSWYYIQEQVQQRLDQIEDANTLVNKRQSEIIDNLFKYSSIVRVAKYNSCSETAFEWWQLVAASKVLGLEVKKAPCPWFVTKDLYHHNAWRRAYPGYRIPETTALVIPYPKLKTT